MSVGGVMITEEIQRQMVPGSRLRHGRDPQYRPIHERLYADRPVHLAGLQEQGRIGAIVRGRSGFAQSIRHNSGQSRAAQTRQGGAGLHLHRLGVVGARPGGDQPLSIGRQADLFRQCPGNR